VRPEKSITGVFDCRFDPIFAFADNHVRQSDRRKLGKPGRDINFHINGIRINPDDGTADDFDNHGTEPLPLVYVNDDRLPSVF